MRICGMTNYYRTLRDRTISDGVCRVCGMSEADHLPEQNDGFSDRSATNTLRLRHCALAGGVTDHTGVIIR